MKKLTILLALFTCIFPANNLLRAQCAPPTAQADLDIANVRARIQCGGDMWWNPVASLGPMYEVPKGSGKHSMFSGSIWVGGYDALNNLHVAAQTYRQDGLDFWPGPLDTTSASTNPASCLQFDQVWKITRQEVIDFIGGSPATVPINTWPGNGSGNQAHYLAPFHDANADGIYNPANGDYPDFGFTAAPNCCSILHGDQAIWWVINDAGNIHSETGGSPFGIEIRCQAFAYSTGDADINNTTFYQYILINRSSNNYNSTYFGLFADVDLGNYLDDYIGCDVPRGMGYCYNGDSNDDGPTGYGLNPPAIGVDILQGPLADADGADNNRNCIIDEPGESIIMTNFQTWDNSFTYMGNPENATHYYNYLKSTWKNGSQVTYASTGIPCTFLFPGNSDHLYEWGTGGNCVTPAPAQADWFGNGPPGDGRFLVSGGPFTLGPGAVHCITTATVWARDLTSPGPYYSVAALRAADDKAQLFFDNCFDVNMLGINNPENIEANIFPNPVNDMLEVRLGNIITEGTFNIYDVRGQIVKQVTLKQQQKFSVPCKDLSSGIYVYQILLLDGKTSAGKIMKE